MQARNSTPPPPRPRTSSRKGDLKTTKEWKKKQRQGGLALPSSKIENKKSDFWQVHAYNPSYWEAEITRITFQGQTRQTVH
jgi:hypothetical protein